jgi:multidrug efflux pump subunit AcrB
VVNNAIVLIDKVNQLRRSGLEREAAVIEACHVRLRPIVMTTLTTVLGLIPMALAIGEGSELRAPLAITVCFGLAFSTLLTLVVIPSVYLLVPSRAAAVESPEVETGSREVAS